MDTEAVGLVLEGGAMRGLFTAGVLDVLLEQEIFFPVVIGVSAGAAFGCNYKSGQKGRVLRYNLAYCRDPRYASLRSLLQTGDLFGAEFCYRELPERLDPFDDEAFARSPMRFYVVCTDVDNGKPVYRLCRRSDGRTLDWMRASASMPLASRVVEIDGRRLLDGGIADPIPIRFARYLGCRWNVVVLTQPRDYVKKKSAALPAMKAAFRREPKLYEAMANRHLVYEQSRREVFAGEAAGNTLVILPQEKLPTGRVEHDPDKIRRTYQMGREAAEQALDRLRRFAARENESAGT